MEPKHVVASSDGFYPSQSCQIVSHRCKAQVLVAPASEQVLLERAQAHAPTIPRQKLAAVGHTLACTSGCAA